MPFPLENGAISGAVAAVIDCSVNVVCHVWQVELASHGVIYATLAGIYNQSRVMSEVEAWKKGI